MRRVRGIHTKVGTCIKMHCALSEFPQYRISGSLTEEQLRRATLIIDPSRSYRNAAWQAAIRGELPNDPIIAAFIPSVYDSRLAPSGSYTWSAYVVWVPTRPRRGTWASRKRDMAERIFQTMDGYAPNFSRPVLDYVLFTPADLEERMHLTDGNIHHLDTTPTQLLWQRPLEELANYHTPVENLYLCGAGMHPCGEVSGGPGYNAAHRILRDLP